MSDAGDVPEVGPLAEEAAKLFGALSGWAREHAGDASDGLSGMAAQAASAVHGIDEHLATGAAECTVCPLCRAMHAARQINPEVTTHLASAVASLAHAATALMATHVSSERARPNVEHIDLNDDWTESRS